MGKMLMGNMDRHRWFLIHSDPQQYMRNAMYVGTGGERFLETAHMSGLASTDWTWTVRFADLDEDGRQDFFATNGIPVFADNPDIGNRVAKLWGERRYQAALDVMRNMPRVDEKNIARRNVGDLQFEDCGAEWGLDESGVTHGAVVVDLDGDGDLDIVTNNLNADASVFENRSAGSHRIALRLHGADGNHHGVGARVEIEAGGRLQVQQVSLTRGYMSAGDATLFFGLGEAQAVTRCEVRWPSGRRQIFEGLEVDHRHDIWEDAKLPPYDEAVEEILPVWTAEAIDYEHRERDFDDFVAQPLLPHRLSRLGPGVACGDVDGDGDDDVWCGGAAGQAGALLRNKGGSFERVSGPWDADAESEDLGSVFVDFDRDGDLDLFVASGGVEAGDDATRLHDRLYVNDGSGRFERAPEGVLPAAVSSSSGVAAADFDRDGDLDLFVGCRVEPGRFPHAGVSRLLRNDAGTFAANAPTKSFTPSLRADFPGRRVQSLRLGDPQAGLHLRPARHLADRARRQRGHGVGRRRLAAHAVPAEARPRGRREAARSRRRGAEDDVREPLHAGGLAGGRARAGVDRRLPAQGDGREVPDRSFARRGLNASDEPQPPLHAIEQARRSRRRKW